MLCAAGTQPGGQPGICHPGRSAGGLQERPIELSIPMPTEPTGLERVVEGAPMNLLRFGQRAIDIEDQACDWQIRLSCLSAAARTAGNLPRQWVALSAPNQSPDGPGDGGRHGCRPGAGAADGMVTTTNCMEERHPRPRKRRSGANCTRLLNIAVVTFIRARPRPGGGCRLRGRRTQGPLTFGLNDSLRRSLCLVGR